MSKGYLTPDDLEDITFCPEKWRLDQAWDLTGQHSSLLRKKANRKVNEGTEESRREAAVIAGYLRGIKPKEKERHRTYQQMSKKVLGSNRETFMDKVINSMGGLMGIVIFFSYGAWFLAWVWGVLTG